MLYALAENGDLPPVFARVNAEHRTPTVAIWFSAAVAAALAVSGSFVTLAAVSTVARLVVYLGVTTAALALRRESFRTRVAGAAFLIPLGPTVPVLASVVSAATLAGASRVQLWAGAAALAGGAGLYAAAVGRRKRLPH
jgi:amino acid transporter